MNENSFFKQVTTENEHKLFDIEWAKICVEEGVKFQPFNENSERFFILDGTDVIGTIEMTKRNPNEFSVCEENYAFSQDERVSNDYSKVFEVGKISIKKEHRNSGHVLKLINFMYWFSEKHDVEQYIGFMNFKFFRLLNRVFKVDILQLSAVTKSEKNTALPVLLDIEKTKKILLKRGVLEPLFAKKA